MENEEHISIDYLCKNKADWAVSILRKLPIFMQKSLAPKLMPYQDEWVSRFYDQPTLLSNPNILQNPAEWVHRIVMEEVMQPTQIQLLHLAKNPAEWAHQIIINNNINNNMLERLASNTADWAHQLVIERTDDIPNHLWHTIITENTQTWWHPMHTTWFKNCIKPVLCCNPSIFHQPFVLF